MWASWPTARSAHAFSHLIDADLNATLSGGILLGRDDPTDPLVARQWGDISPEPLGIRVGFDGAPEVCRYFVDRAVRDLLSDHTWKRVGFAERPRSVARRC